MTIEPMDMDKRAHINRKIGNMCAELCRKTNGAVAIGIVIIPAGENGAHIIDGAAGHLPDGMTMADLLRSLADGHEKVDDGMEGYVQ